MVAKKCATLVVEWTLITGVATSPWPATNFGINWGTVYSLVMLHDYSFRFWLSLSLGECTAAQRYPVMISLTGRVVNDNNTVQVLQLILRFLRTLCCIIWYSITHSLFHSRLKTFLFCKSFPPQPFLFLLQDSLQTFYCHFWAYLLSTFSFSVFTL